MLFKVKLKSGKHDKIHAESEEDLKEVCKLIGDEVSEILDKEVTLADKIKNKTPIKPLFKDDVNYNKQDGLIPIIQPPQEILFSDNGVQFKIINGEVYKKDWIDVNHEEYRIRFIKEEDIIQLQALSECTIQKLDWIKIK